MTKDEAVEQLKNLPSDSEIAHSMADDILIAFLHANGLSDIAQAWQDADDKCGGFWYA